MSPEDLASIPDSDEERNCGEKTAVLCPACGSKLTRRSMRRSWKDRFKSLFGIWPYRCQLCSVRFTGPKDVEAIARHNAHAELEMRRREQLAFELDDGEDEEIGEEWSINPTKVAHNEPDKH